MNGSEIRCLNPAVTRDEFVLVDGYLEINACPVVAFGSPAGSDDGPFSDAMRAVGLEPGEPHRHVEILQDVRWSLTASRAAHAQEAVFEQFAVAADAARAQGRTHGEHDEDYDHADDLGAAPTDD